MLQHNIEEIRAHRRYAGNQENALTFVMYCSYVLKYVYMECCICIRMVFGYSVM